MEHNLLHQAKRRCFHSEMGEKIAIDEAILSWTP
jgi:hypothetical protein